MNPLLQVFPPACPKCLQLPHQCICPPPIELFMKKSAKPTFFDAFEPIEIIVPVFRYYLGRMTIATCAFAEGLARQWALVPPNAQDVIRRELDRAFEEDDRARAEASQYKPLGMDCDRQSWQLVRNAYGQPALPKSAKPTKEACATAFNRRFGKPDRPIEAADVRDMMEVGGELQVQVHVYGFTDWYAVKVDAQGQLDPVSLEQLPF